MVDLEDNNEQESEKEMLPQEKAIRDIRRINGRNLAFGTLAGIVLGGMVAMRSLILPERSIQNNPYRTNEAVVAYNQINEDLEFLDWRKSYILERKDNGLSSPHNPNYMVSDLEKGLANTIFGASYSDQINAIEEYVPIAEMKRDELMKSTDFMSYNKWQEEHWTDGDLSSLYMILAGVGIMIGSIIGGRILILKNDEEQSRELEQFKAQNIN